MTYIPFIIYYKIIGHISFGHVNQRLICYEYLLFIDTLFHFRVVTQ